MDGCGVLGFAAAKDFGVFVFNGGVVAADVYHHCFVGDDFQVAGDAWDSHDGGGRVDDASAHVYDGSGGYDYFSAAGLAKEEVVLRHECEMELCEAVVELERVCAAEVGAERDEEVACGDEGASGGEAFVVDSGSAREDDG